MSLQGSMTEDACRVQVGNQAFETCRRAEPEQVMVGTRFVVVAESFSSAAKTISYLDELGAMISGPPPLHVRKDSRFVDAAAQ